MKTCRCGVLLKTKAYACNSCKEKRREYLKRTGNAVYHRYEKTFNGFLMRAYRNIKSRVEGIQWKKAHLYSGFTAPSKKDFYAWSRKNKKLKKLFVEWEKSEYQRRLTPSVDRINANYGYVFDNMRWVPFHVNCSNVRDHLRYRKPRKSKIS